MIYGNGVSIDGSNRVEQWTICYMSTGQLQTLHPNQSRKQKPVKLSQKDEKTYRRDDFEISRLKSLSFGLETW
jgi:hypothetical protein